jgi:hypothetical protein
VGSAICIKPSPEEGQKKTSRGLEKMIKKIAGSFFLAFFGRGRDI